MKLTQTEFLMQAIKKHGSAYKFCKHYKIDQAMISRAKHGGPISLIMARAIADTLATNENERIKIIGEILK